MAADSRKQAPSRDITAESWSRSGAKNPDDFAETEAAAAEHAKEHDKKSARPQKPAPGVRAGDAGGPGAGRNITTADLTHDHGHPPPNELEPIAFSERDPKKRD